MIKIKVFKQGVEVGVFNTLAQAAVALDLNRVYLSQVLKNTIKVYRGYRFKILKKGHGRNNRKRLKRQSL